MEHAGQTDDESGAIIIEDGMVTIKGGTVIIDGSRQMFRIEGEGTLDIEEREPD